MDQNSKWNLTGTSPEEMALRGDRLNMDRMGLLDATPIMLDTQIPIVSITLGTRVLIV